MADAELEASEVLHSLLSVERVENKSLPTDGTAAETIDDSNILWHTPVQGLQSTFLHGDKLILQSDLAASYHQDQVRFLKRTGNGAYLLNRIVLMSFVSILLRSVVAFISR